MSDVSSASTSAQKTVLNVGCGEKGASTLPPWFPAPTWREVRIDIDPNVEPDIVSSCTDMRGKIADASADAIWSAHNIEHLYAHEVELALREFARVIKPDGIVLIVVPNVQKAAEMIAQDKLEDTAYMSGAGPITPLDMLWGLRSDIARGRTYMAHRTGFTASTLRRALINVGLPFGEIKPISWDLLALATKQNFGSITLGPSQPANH